MKKFYGALYRFLIIILVIATFVFPAETNNVKVKAEAESYTTAAPKSTVTSSAIDISKLEIEKDLPSLKDVYKDYFPMGASVSKFILNPDPLQELVLKHYNILTPGNLFKWNYIHPEDGKFTFELTDKLMDFAEEHNMEVIGHTLIWHHKDVNPKWLFTDEAGNEVSREVLLKRMEEHIKTIVGRYKGRIKGWDVVNEAIDIKAPDNLRETKWKKIIGNDYLEYAYKYAHEADPDAELYYNDYGEDNAAKSDAVYNLVKNLIAKGCKINSIGMQSHYGLNVSANAVKSAIEKFTSLGVKVEISELDIGAYSNDEADKFKNGLTAERSAVQARKYAELFNVYKQFKDKIGRVTTWGTFDGQTQLNSPLLFDKSLKAKEAFYAVIDPEKYLNINRSEPNTNKDNLRGTDEIKVNIDGSLITFEDMKPIIQNDRVLVPMRKIFEALSTVVSWDDGTQTVTATNGYKTIVLTIGDKTAMVDRQSITLDVPAVVMSDRTMVPVRFIAESLGTEVTWDDETNTVYIKSK